MHGEGMPIPKDPSRKGRLRIKFDVEFPTVLTLNQKSTVTRLFRVQRDMDKDGHGENMVVANRKMDATQGEN